MTNLPFDPQTLPELIEQGYITRQTHPKLPLTIYNYTAKAQFDRFWVPATLNCRGLVLDDRYYPIARPLPKFFNLEEYQGTIPDGVPNIYEKLDGSLIILFHYQGSWEVASRGSFASEQAQTARAFLQNYQLDGLDREYTYLFEIIYPNNRIVVDYGTAERLVLLAAVHTQTGAELDHNEVNWIDRAETYPATAIPEWVKSIEARQAELNNHEGFILKWPNGFRLKYKLADYVRLHRIITRVQAKDIWECLSQNQNLDQFLDSVPDEFYNWVKDTRVKLETQYQDIETECQRVFAGLGDVVTDYQTNRREVAIYFQTQKYPGILFLMLDGRDYTQVIWKLIKPPYQLPFRSDNDEREGGGERGRGGDGEAILATQIIQSPSPLVPQSQVSVGVALPLALRSQTASPSSRNMKLILTKGLPASGKTTWAKEYIQKYPETANLCKDDLRLQLGGTNKREKRVIKVRDMLTEYYFSQGYSVIWSDTNLNPVHLRRATELAAQHQAQVSIKDFTKVELAECIKRDLVRPNSVGQQAIEQMYYDYIHQSDPAPPIDPNLPNCYIVDIDGTLAINNTRNPFAWDKVGEDALNPAVAEMVEKLGRDSTIIIFSGRSSVCRELTIGWLKEYNIDYKDLFMRPADDQRADDVLKSELYYQNIRDRYNVLGVIDDRPKVCRMWRRLGLSVFQVGNPDYEF